MQTRYFFWVEAATLLICIVCYSKYTLLRYKLFFPYLFIVVLYEWCSMHRMFAIKVPGLAYKTNVWAANFELLFEFIFYSYFTISILKSAKQRRLLGWICFGVAVFTVIDIFFIQGFINLSSIAILMQYALLIFMVCRFFYIKMQDIGHLSIWKDPDFWVHTGMLFFFLAEFMFFASYTNMASKNLSLYRLLFSVVTNVAILILYPCLSISFLCFRPTKKISS